MNVITSLKAGFELFQKGKVVANAQAWKTGQITVSVLAPVLVAVVGLLRSFGVDIPVDDVAANNIAVGVLAVVGVVFTIVSSDKVGLPSKQAEVITVSPAPGPGPFAGH